MSGKAREWALGAVVRVRKARTRSVTAEKGKGRHGQFEINSHPPLVRLRAISAFASDDESKEP